jgi:hypothetical protein
MSKYISIFFFLFILSKSSFACSAAYQYSLFPLGSSMGRVIVFEMELDRYLRTPDNQMMQMGGGRRFDNKDKKIEVRWKGTIKVYMLEAGKLVLSKDLGVIDILDDDYDEALLPYFKKAYEVAQALPMFEEAVLETIGACHHDRSCHFITLTIDEENVKFYANSNEEGYQDKKCLVPFAEKTLLKVEMQTKIKFTDFENIEKGFQVDFFRLWSQETVRRYSIGNLTIQVFTLGRGDKSRYMRTKEEKWKTPNVENIAHYIQGNDVIFHGQRFDFIQIL